MVPVSSPLVILNLQSFMSIKLLVIEKMLDPDLAELLMTVKLSRYKKGQLAVYSNPPFFAVVFINLVLFI